MSISYWARFIKLRIDPDRGWKKNVDCHAMDGQAAPLKCNQKCLYLVHGKVV